jgi:hypothetical protein
MDVRRDARRASTSEGATDMADETLRRCIGSARFGIEPHEAPVEDFPRQPSQKDGLGRMCKVHWNQYTAGLARDAKARTATEGQAAPTTELAGGQPATSAKKGRGASKPAAAKARTAKAVVELAPNAAPTAEA